MSEDITESDITALLATKYSGNDWAFCSQVPNGTGHAKTRTADGLAMGLWPSKGLHLHGFEIKVNRSDWLKEIQDVSKAAAFSRFCHYWWVVAPKGVVKLEEMPADWGLVIAGKSLRTQKAATLRDPESPDHTLLAGIFRACSKQDGQMSAINSAYQKGRNDAFSEAQKRAKGHRETDKTLAERQLESLRKSLEAFERISGVKIDEWNGESVAETYEIAKRLKAVNLNHSLGGMIKRLQAVNAELESISNYDLLSQHMEET